jgi:hypothetical protein
MKNSIASAFALASLLAAGTMGGCASDDTSSKEQGVKCAGINTCKGTSECAGGAGANGCEGMNECKGMGWVTAATAKECTDKGGKVL